MNLTDDKQQNIQMELDLSSALTGEAREAGREETESSRATNGTESPASTNRLMEEVCERENLKAALRQVRGNQGSPGVDGMTVVGLKDYLKQHWPAIREQLLNGTYEPMPVRRVEIPKPDGGGVRKLGIPSVLDRFIQQAVMQVLQRRWDRTFSDHSYGFRPGRSAHQAVAQAQQYIAEGYGWCVDLDLEKFFDRVNHDKLMGQIAKRVEDKRLGRGAVVRLPLVYARGRCRCTAAEYASRPVPSHSARAGVHHRRRLQRASRYARRAGLAATGMAGSPPGARVERERQGRGDRRCAGFPARTSPPVSRRGGQRTARRDSRRP